MHFETHDQRCLTCGACQPLSIREEFRFHPSSIIARHLTECHDRLRGQHNANVDRARETLEIAPALVAFKKLDPLFAPNRSGT